jgi:hypothetical protein
MGLGLTVFEDWREGKKKMGLGTDPQNYRQIIKELHCF